MTDRTELRRLLDEATPGPWALYDGWLHEGRAHVARIGNAAGNGIGAPATDMAGEIADFELIASAVNALPGLLDQLDAAEAALARVREIHQPYKVYDECDCDDDAKNDGRHVEVEAALATSSTGISCFGWTCNHLYTACDECCTEGMGYITEHCAIYHDHGPDKPICPTIRALDATTGGES